MLSNDVELGLVAYPVKNPKLEIVALRKEPLVLVCHPPTPVREAGQGVAAGSQWTELCWLRAKHPHAPGIGPDFKTHRVGARYEVEFDNVDTVKRAVEIGTGVSIVPEATILPEVAKRTLVTVPIADGDFFRPTAAIYKRKKILTPAMKQLLTVLKEPA